MKTSLSVVGLTGHARAGKNHVGNLIRDFYGYITWAYAFPLKQRVYSTRDEWPLENVVGQKGKSEELRRVLQQEGTERARQAIREDIWVRATEAFLYLVESEWAGLVNGVVICDVRFPNEAEYIRQRQGKILRIRNDDLDLSLPMYNHGSETSINDIEVDGVIDNTGQPDKQQLLKELQTYFFVNDQET